MNSARVLLPAVGHLADANARTRHPAEMGAWIWHPKRVAGETAFLRFTRRFELADAADVLIHVTGDQRFQLRCDGHEVTFGPDRCDIEHWTVQSLRLSLPAGKHVLEAVVWWLAEPGGTSRRVDQDGSDDVPKPPMAQMTWRGGFLVFTEDLQPEVLNTGSADWTVEDVTDAVRLFRQRIPHYIDVGPSFAFDLERWEPGETVSPIVIEPALCPNPYGVRRPGWCLHPAPLPEQQREDWTGGCIRAVREGWGDEAFTPDDVKNISNWQDLVGGKPATIPAYTKLTVLWDFQDYYCGYPLLFVRGGRGSNIEWDWAEALYEERSTQAVATASTKGQRGEIIGKAFLGFGDRWHLGARSESIFPALWWRAGRYVRLRIATASEPLVLERIGLRTTGYPLQKGGSWQSSDADWDRVMPIFERAFRCAAHETWTDTPYYEQMCYVGDNLMHALTNYAWFTDDRISRRSLELFEWSRRPSGLVAERYPSSWRQESVTYSMLWPMMVRDYAHWRDDPAFIKRLLPGIRSVVAEIEGLKRENGLLGSAPGWPFVDWVPEWQEGCGPGVREGDSSILNLYWVLCLQAAAEIEGGYGDPMLGVFYRRQAEETFAALVARFWDETRGLLLDTVGHKKASEHAQVFALLTGLLDAEKTRRCLDVLCGGEDLSHVTISAAFYLLDALYRHGQESEFHRRLQFWRALPDQGFTSTPEGPEPSRSDAHAWGAHPAWHSLASIAGIRPSEPGFRRVRIAPCPGAIENLKCSVVHPHGSIEATMKFFDGKVSAVIVLPEGINGEFVWRGIRVELSAGKTTVDV